MSIFFVLAIAAIFVVIILKRNVFSGRKVRPRSHEVELYQKLLRKAFGDKEQVERLIEVERQKNPQANRIVWMKAAIDRWERHNR